jgi:hypothetical protein
MKESSRQRIPRWVRLQEARECKKVLYLGMGVVDDMQELQPHEIRT